MTLRNVAVWMIRIILIVLAIRFAWWAYQSYRPDEPAERPPEVPDVDMECRIIADTGQCFCRHRWTNERLKVQYKKCVALSRRP